MRVKLQLVICSDYGQQETVTDVVTLTKDNQRIEYLGLTLAESKQLLSTLQSRLLQQQVDAFLRAHLTCPDCGSLLGVKAHGSRSFRTLFGTFKLYSPRLKSCSCQRQKMKALSELHTYIVNNRHLIPNYGERYRNGEPIATGFVESTVNEVVSRRFCKKQSMQWSKEGAHLLLQTRVRTLNGELSAIFKRWYPGMDLKAEEMPLAA